MSKKVLKKAKKTVSKRVSTKKRQNEPVKVQEMDLSKPFDLTDVSEATLEAYVGYLKAMKVSAGWKLMEQVLEGNMALLEKQIVRKINVLTEEKLTEEEVDELRIQHAQILQLLETPNTLIAQYGVKDQPAPTPQYDPYTGGMLSNNTYSAGVLSENST